MVKKSSAKIDPLLEPPSLRTANSWAIPVIAEDDSGRIGVGTTLPTSQLTVNGVIEMMGAAGGIKFPDGTLQTTAGLATVSRDNTLKGNGTQASPLGVAVPLNLNGDVRFGSVLVVSNTHEVSTEASGSSDRKCVGRNGEHGGR